MSPGTRLRSRWLVTLIAGITAGPLTALLWLGFKLLQQDRALERQQVQQRVDRAVDVATGETETIVDGPGFGASPIWSPDGTKIYYINDRIIERATATPTPTSSPDRTS